jgi:Tfp pilus assembly protein PilX
MSKSRKHNSKRSVRGFALVVSMLLLLLVTGLALAVMYMAMTQKQVAGSDSETTVAYYGGEAGMEKMMADLADLYQSKQTPSIADLNALASQAPSISGITYTDPNGGTGYKVSAPDNGTGYPVAYTSTVASGANKGLIAQIIPINLAVTARRPEGTEARMFRKVEVALIPVFQFGVFSDADLSYFPGPDFKFGGRVHTNGNLWMASGASLTFFDKITAVGNVIRARLANTFDATAGAYNGSVNIPTSSNGCGTPASPNITPPGCRAMGFNEGSVELGNYCETDPNSAPNCQNSGNAYNPAWNSSQSWNGSVTGPISRGVYAGMILNGQTGATKLSLPFVGNGVSPIEIIKRPKSGDSEAISQSRLANEASIRIWLDDNPNNIPGGLSDGETIPLASVINGGKYLASIAGGTGWVATPSYPFFATATNATNLLKTGASTYGADTKWRLPYQSTALISGGTDPNSSLVVDPFSSAIFPGAQPDSDDGSSTVKTSTSISGSSYLQPGAGTHATDWPLLSGWLRVEYTPAVGATAYRGITREWLSYGWTRQYDQFPDREHGVANTMESKAIIILQQKMPSTRNSYGDTFNNSSGYSSLDLRGYDLLPINMYDRREGELRDTTSGKSSSSCAVNGLMNVVEIDVGNLKDWLAGNGYAGHGALVDKATFNGYILYFSDRRGGSLDGGYDYLDTTNATNSIVVSSSPTASPNVSTGVADGVLSAEEDVYQGYQGAGKPSIYPSELGSDPVTKLITPPPYIGAAFGFGKITAGNPGVSQRIASCATTGAWNVVLAPRHALRLVNGTLDNLPTPGFTVASEQPVYVVGNYNATDSQYAPTIYSDSAAAVIADTVTLLSKGYKDFESSLNAPITLSAATSSAYRLAIASGKTLTFKQPSGFSQDYGTDGGVHNFLRYLENWGGQSLYYSGSMVSLYYSRYGTGAFKCCTTVYSPPARRYYFDSNFLTPSLLPPGTPTFKDVVDLGFQQDLNP